MGKLAKQNRQEKQERLLKLFVGDWYQEKDMGDEVYVKQWNGATNKWQVAVFSKESFRRYKAYSESHGPIISNTKTMDEFKDDLEAKLSEKLKEY